MNFKWKVPELYASFLNKATDLRVDTGIDKLKYFPVVNELCFDFVKVLFVLDIIPYYFHHIRIDYILTV